MVTSTKLPDKKVVKMAEQNNSVVIPQRTLLGEVNEHITCPLCRGYYIDATTIVECLHSFCRSCIIKHLQIKSYCPVCEMMINSAKPNIKLDKALQDIVYKLVPGLFQKEMERRQQFYASRPGPAASATPEQRGEDTERIIFSPEDVISFSMEYADVTDTDSISSKSSDSNDPQPPTAISRRYLQCPAVVNISHLKKFLSMKFDIDSSQFAIDILYKRVPLPDYYTLMDIAYIYNWKRNEPMRFFYQIVDYIAIRNRLFDINRKGSNFRDRKSSPTSTEDTNIGSPAPTLNEQCSETSSGTDSPMPEEKTKTVAENFNNDKSLELSKESHSLGLNQHRDSSSSMKKNEDVEKSQFLNSFELTAKNNCLQLKSPIKSDNSENNTTSTETENKNVSSPIKQSDHSFKRKHSPVPQLSDTKKLKIDQHKTKATNVPTNNDTASSTLVAQISKNTELQPKLKEFDVKSLPNTPMASTQSTSELVKETKQQILSNAKLPESPTVKRSLPGQQNIPSPKRKLAQDTILPMRPPPPNQKLVSPLKLQIPKLDPQTSSSKTIELQKLPAKKVPESKSNVPASQNKSHPINKIRMDLLANNSDPTIDRSKILSQVKTSLGLQNAGQHSGDPLKSLFDSCKINIPSSLSITLTDQKLEPRNSNELTNSEQSKNILNKNLCGMTNSSIHKIPSPPVHNYIEITKLPDTDHKKQQQQKTDTSSDTKTNPSKVENASAQSKHPNKSNETSTKGPIPNLKPIADTKLGKQINNVSAPTTFQQTFEQQLLMKSDNKPKLHKNRLLIPKLMLATPKTLNTVNKINTSTSTSSTSSVSTVENKSAALDLSTPHSVQSQLGPQQTKAFETMQSIANLAKKQNLSSNKSLPTTIASNSLFSGISNRPLSNTLSVPNSSNINTIKLDKMSTNSLQSNNVRQELPSKTSQVRPTSNISPTILSPNYQLSSQTLHNTTHPSPRSQTRSPSSSPKLVIAEDKQSSTSSSDHNINQSNQITSTQLANLNMSKNESHKVIAGPSKSGLKPVKPLTPTGKLTGIKQPITPVMKPNTSMSNAPDYLSQPQIIPPHAFLRQQMEMQHAWFKATQYDIMKKMNNIAHQSQNDFNNKDK